MSGAAMNERMDAAEIRALALEAVGFIPDAARMLYAAVRDPRVPRGAKVRASACLALLALPVQALPVIGELELVGIATLAAGQLVAGAGEEILREHWRGSDRGFRLLMLLVSVGFKPRHAARTMLLKTLGAAAGPGPDRTKGPVVIDHHR